MTTTNSELLTRDIKLLALSQRLKDARVEAVRLSDRTARLKGTPEFGRASDANEAAWKRYGEIEDQIGATSATTIVKAANNSSAIFSFIGLPFFFRAKSRIQRIAKAFPRAVETSIGT